MLPEALVQCRPCAGDQGMSAYSNKPWAAAATGAELSWLEEEIDTPLRPTGSRRKLSQKSFAT
jgi:hypothetical protein